MEIKNPGNQPGFPFINQKTNSYEITVCYGKVTNF